MKKKRINKAKTKNAIKKRVRVTGSGKLLIREMLSQHRVSGKSKRRRRLSGKLKPLHRSEVKKVKRMLPYVSN